MQFENSMIMSSPSAKRSSALRPSKLQSSKFGNGNGNSIRAVSFLEDPFDSAPEKVDQENQQIFPDGNLSTKRGSFMRRKKNANKNSVKDFSITSGKENGGADETGSSSPRKWGSRRFRKGFSLFGSATTGNGYGTLEDTSNDEEHDVETPSPMEADPVMTIFEKRNTQRVRFTLAGDNDSIISSNNNKRKGLTDKKRGSSNGLNSNNSSAGNIKQFMSRALFGSSKHGSSSSNKKLLEEEMKREVKELGGGSLIWESATTPTGPEVIHTKHIGSNKEKSKKKMVIPELTVSFTEDPKARAAVAKLLSKASKAEHCHFRYEYAVKCYLKALNILQKQATYPDDHPTVVKTVKLMNNAHHVLSSYNNSANIVKMGIKNEDAGELVKALKMYTIAYRIRRDNLSRNHPSLVVLLNMLGSIQIKRGELKEAMQIYELALKDDEVVSSEALNGGEMETQTNDRNLLAKSVTFREMGTIYEMWGNVDEALKFYHKSLDCVAEWREKVKKNKAYKSFGQNKNDGSYKSKSGSQRHTDCESKLFLNENGASSNTCHYSIDDVQTISGVGDGEMELVIGSTNATQKEVSCNSKSINKYEKFFPQIENPGLKGEVKSSDENSHADMDLSLTLHQIAQLYRAQGKFHRALNSYEVALRGMRMALGKHHPNVAAVLGNIGNLQKEMGDLGAAYNTYQEVLGIESYRLGLSHPDVAITLHNIATIDAARGNYEHSLQLYKKVIGLQKKLFGEENLSVAVTAACMGDVFEKIGDLQGSMSSFDEAVRIKSAILGRHSLEVGRLLHKLGKLSFLLNDNVEAESFIARTLLIYRLNKLDENHEWFIDANRDAADIEAALAVVIAEKSEI